MKKILFVIGSLRVGGAERQMTLLAKEIAKCNVDVKVFVLTADGPLKDYLEKLKISIIDGGYELKASKFKKGFLLFRCQLKLIWTCLSWRPQIVHAFLPHSNFMASVSARIAFLPFIITSWRSLTNYRVNKFSFYLLDYLAMRLSSCIVCNSQAVLNDICKENKALILPKSHVIYNGVALSSKQPDENDRCYGREILGLSPEDIGLVYVANLIPYKGHLDLIEAFTLLKKIHRNLKLFLIGEDRGILHNLEKHTHELQTDKDVVFLGGRKDVSTLLRCMDIGIMASHEEGFSNALLEKLAAGLPIVATNVGGNPEALENMTGCLLVGQRNPIEMYEALDFIIRNLEELKSKSTDRIQRTYNRFSINTMVNQYMDIYQNFWKKTNISLC